MRALILTNIFPSDPSWFRGNFVLDQAQSLRDRGCDVSIAVLQAIAPPGSERRRSTKIDAEAYGKLNLHVDELVSSEVAHPC